MKLKAFLLILLLWSLAACSPAGGGSEPAASDDPTTEIPPVSEDGETPNDPGAVIVDEVTVEEVDILILESFPVQVKVNVSGFLADGCTTLADISTVQEGDTYFVTLTGQRPAEAVCTQQLVSFDETVALDVNGLSAGTYTVNVNGVTETFTLDVDNIIDLPGTGGEGVSGVDLPREDLAELIRLTLERALIDEKIPDYALLADQEMIVLSTENIDASLVPELEGVPLNTMTPEEIQAKADNEGDFPYLRFQEFTAVSTERVQVSLGSQWGRAADSETLYLSGGGFTIEYKKSSDGWQGEITAAWIS